MTAKTYRQDSSVNISKDIKAALSAHLNGVQKIGKWVELAISEKIKREQLQDNVVLQLHDTDSVKQ